MTASGGCTPWPMVTSYPPSGSTFPIGATTVTSTATDACGNSTNCSFTVTVNPIIYPPLVLNCAPNLTVTATDPSGAVVFFNVTASGGCSLPAVTSDPPSGSTFPIGTTTVTSTASDTCGDSTNCSFTVTVSPAPTMNYVGNDLSVSYGAVDSSPPLVILGEYSPDGPLGSSATSFPDAGTITGVSFYGDNYNFTLYVLSPVGPGPNANEQIFQVVGWQGFQGSAATGLQSLTATNLAISAGDLLAFAGSGPYYNSSDAPGSDATYEDAANPNSFTATAPGGPPTQFTVGMVGDSNATYDYISDVFQNQGRNYGIGVVVASTSGSPPPPLVLTCSSNLWAVFATPSG